MVEPMLAIPVTLTKMLGKNQNISISVLIPAAFSKILERHRSTQGRGGRKWHLAKKGHEFVACNLNR